ncbi:MAG: hypothetical protein WCY86_04940 [Spirosomataceae bacterium]
MRLFTAQPVAPYSDNDLWMSENGLRRSVRNKTTGQPFDPNDWVEPFNFDNTATAIDGHIITSGIIQLAGDKNAIWAGVSGQGTEDESVRFWAGASTENRDTAPFRVFQNGWLFARNRIEVEGVDATSPTGFKGQAGLAGSDTEDATGVRIYAGSDYDGKESAPFRVTGQGYVIAEKGQFGNMQIRNGGLVNMDTEGNVTGHAVVALHRENNEGSVVIGTDALPAYFGDTNAMMSVRNTRNGPGDNYGAIFSASGGEGFNYALKTGAGLAWFERALINGRSSLTLALLSGETFPIDPSHFDFISLIYNNGAAPGIQFVTGINSKPMFAGKRVTIESRNDVRQFWIMNTIKGENRQFPGGAVITLVYNGSEWKIESGYDNDW